jgi:hypothetical protein
MLEVMRAIEGGTVRFLKAGQDVRKNEGSFDSQQPPDDNKLPEVIETSQVCCTVRSELVSSGWSVSLWVSECVIGPRTQGQRKRARSLP